MKLPVALLLMASAAAFAEDDLSQQLLAIKRVYVDRLTGGELRKIRDRECVRSCGRRPGVGRGCNGR